MDPRPAKAISARVVVAVVAALVAVGAGGAVEFARLLPGLEQDSVNQRFERRGTQPAPGLLVVAIDMTLAPEAPYPACVRSFLFQAPPCRSRIAGNGPGPCG